MLSVSLGIITVFCVFKITKYVLPVYTCYVICWYVDLGWRGMDRLLTRELVVFVTLELYLMFSKLLNNSLFMDAELCYIMYMIL